MRKEKPRNKGERGVAESFCPAVLCFHISFTDELSHIPCSLFCNCHGACSLQERTGGKDQRRTVPGNWIALFDRRSPSGDQLVMPIDREGTELSPVGESISAERSPWSFARFPGLVQEGQGHR